MKNKIILSLAVLFVIAAILFFTSPMIPKNATPVGEFNVNRYLGRWYEIARIDHTFEKDLNNVTAEYSLNENGTIKVVNTGYNYSTKKWKSAEGKAKFRNDTTTAALKVSFFGPFYSGYNVIALDNDYQHALVAGKNLDYLWILSRQVVIPDSVRKDFLDTAKNSGYDTSRLIWVEHNKEQTTADGE